MGRPTGRPRHGVKTIVIGSRGSALALAQTRLVLADLQIAWPDRVFDLKIIKTQGDRLSADPARTLATEPLSKGLFTAELEKALLGGEIDLAVHSLKDMPTAVTPGLVLAALPPRADARDLLITRGPVSLDQLPADALIATGSPRRAAQLRLARPDLTTALIRGNIDTRLRKFRETPEWHALILASAGLARLQPDLSGLVPTSIPFSIMLPAPGQGALALQTRDDATAIIETLQVLHDPVTAAQVSAERSFLHALGGGCQQPIAALATVFGDEIRLQGIAWLNEESAPRKGQKLGSLREPEKLGQQLAEQISS